jgi:PTH1 family peptidyl-tRNA hydrolase
MNESGKSVQQALNFYKLEAKSLIAVHDEIEFNFGRFEMKFGGGHKGHNGIRSIMSFINTGDFHRLRFGVGRPDDPRVSVSDYVLGNFLGSEIEVIQSKLPDVCDMLVEVVGSLGT